MPVYLLASKAALISSLTPISNGFVLDELVIFLINQEESLGDFSVYCFIKIELIAAVWIETAKVVCIDTHGLLQSRQLRVHSTVALVLGLSSQCVPDVAILNRHH